MLMSDMIQQMIEELLLEAGNEPLDLQRNELANKLGCVPSQINYVISSRFTKERGYIIESKRGGGGYVRIRRIQVDPLDALHMAFGAIGHEIDMRTATALIRNLAVSECITAREAALMLAAISDRTLQLADSRYRDFVRADILKSMLLSVIGCV